LISEENLVFNLIAWY